MKQFKEFRALVPTNFASLMVDFWEKDESLTRDEVIEAYYSDKFKIFAARISGTAQTFKPDLGYANKSIDGTVCFEIDDNNVVIPIEILEVIDD